MADAYARATRRPSFVQLHIAPGLGNAMGMLFNAHASRTPMVVYAGQAASDVLAHEPLLSADLVDMAKPVTKWGYEPSHAVEVPQALRRAITIASDPPQGPVLLSLPIDVMDDSADVRIAPTSLTSWQVRPDPQAIDQAAEMLAASDNPLLLIGDGVALCGGQHHVARLAQKLGAPIWQAYSSEVNVPFDDPMLAGSLPNTSSRASELTARLLAQHDVVLAIGAPVFRFVFPQPGPALPTGVQFVHIDLDGRELGRSTVGGLLIKSDCAVAAQELCRRLDSRPLAAAPARTERIRAEIAAARAAALERDREHWDDQPISVPRLMAEIAAALPPGTAIFDEAMTSSSTLLRYITPAPGHYFRARGGGIGPGIPGAVGLKLALGDTPVIGIVSDGASMYSLTALWTAAHHGIPVVIVVCNNGSYRILKENLADYLGESGADRRFVELDLTAPELRFDQIAEAMGVHGRRVEDPDELGPALRAAFALGRPAVIDVPIQK
jgi:benzoylformate decarboxylase